MATFHRPRRFRLNWRAYFTPRVLTVIGISFVAYGLDLYAHLHYAGKSGEMLIGAVLGHCILEVE